MIVQICVGIMVFCTGVAVGFSIVSWAMPMILQRHYEHELRQKERLKNERL